MPYKYKEDRWNNTKKWRKNNPEKMKIVKRRYYLKKSYGISPEEYEDLLNKQSGVCGICGTNEPSGFKNETFSVDHNHETGEVRGLLCMHCNVGLGMFKEKEENLLKAIIYLKN